MREHIRFRFGQSLDFDASSLPCASDYAQNKYFVAFLARAKLRGQLSQLVLGLVELFVVCVLPGRVPGCLISETAGFPEARAGEARAGQAPARDASLVHRQHERAGLHAGKLDATATRHCVCESQDLIATVAFRQRKNRILKFQKRLRQNQKKCDVAITIGE